jgi:hypothetical protein
MKLDKFQRVKSVNEINHYFKLFKKLKKFLKVTTIKKNVNGCYCLDVVGVKWQASTPFTTMLEPTFSQFIELYVNKDRS